jgi:hypothetical protein
MVRTAAERTVSQNNLKQIMLALHNQHDAYGMFLVPGTGAMGIPIYDPSAKPLLSWRVSILPFIEQNELYSQFKQDEPWDSEHNKKLIGKMPKIFAPPAGAKTPPGHTHYQLIVGPAAVQPSLRIVQITDGTSNTLSVVEAAKPVIWTKPDDIFIPTKEMPSDLKKSFGGLFVGGFNSGLWDGSVRWIEFGKISDKTLWALITPNGGEDVKFDW